MKKLVNKEIHRIRIGDGYQGVKFSMIPKDLEPDDEIFVNYDEGHQSENNSWDAHTTLLVFREVLESDEEYNTRIKNSERDARWAKERRRENYLKLKKEFENEQL